MTDISKNAELQQSCITDVIPRLFFVVARTSEENLEQITTGLKTYDEAKNYRDSDFCKKRWEYAFVVCSLNEA